LTQHAVVVGCGPTGMMLAAELALAGIDVVIVERPPTNALDDSRAGGPHARTYCARLCAAYLVGCDGGRSVARR
jgi:2-polyprenyl-6-methoxyphenol hydroxylase-like FAD-dependent oxidoreductase